MADLVIRIRFKSGAVSEERGTEEQIEALFEQDSAGLLDYVQGLDPDTGEFNLWVHDHDETWAEI